MALCLADSLIMNNFELDNLDLRKRFLAWWHEGFFHKFISIFIFFILIDLNHKYALNFFILHLRKKKKKYIFGHTEINQNFMIIFKVLYLYIYKLFFIFVFLILFSINEKSDKIKSKY